MERIPITPEGHEKLKKELDHLKSVARPENLKAIEEARAHGDLSENAEFTAAKERQGFIEGRISELNYKFKHMDIITPGNMPSDKVIFASRVLLENVDTDDEIEYQLVGPDESDIDNGKISVTSPLGRSLIGKKPGDEIKVLAPGGTRLYELVEILT